MLGGRPTFRLYLLLLILNLIERFERFARHFILLLIHPCIPIIQWSKRSPGSGSRSQVRPHLQTPRDFFTS